MPGVTSKNESIGSLPLDVHRLVAADERPCPRLCHFDFLPADVANVGLAFFGHSILLYSLSEPSHSP